MNKLILSVLVCLCIFPVDITYFSIICSLLLKNALALVLQIFVLALRLLKFLLHFADFLLNSFEVFLTACVICAIYWRSLIIRFCHWCIDTICWSIFIKFLTLERVFLISLGWWWCLSLWFIGRLFDHILRKLHAFLRKLWLWCLHNWIYLWFKYITL